MVFSRQRCGGLLVRVLDFIEIFGLLCYVFGQDILGIGYFYSFFFDFGVYYVNGYMQCLIVIEICEILKGYL